MVRPAPIPRRSSHLGSAACPGRSDHGSHSSTAAASSRSKRRHGNHNRFPTLKMFPDGHLDHPVSVIDGGLGTKRLDKSALKLTRSLLVVPRRTHSKFSGGVA